MVVRVIVPEIRTVGQGGAYTETVYVTYSITNKEWKEFEEWSGEKRLDTQYRKELRAASIKGITRKTDIATLTEIQQVKLYRQNKKLWQYLNSKRGSI